MTSPRKVKEVQRLTRRITVLNIFVSRATNKCLPFFKILKKAKYFTWTEESEEAFTCLKAYLSSMPLLSKLVAGETLLLYLVVSNTKVSEA